MNPYWEFKRLSIWLSASLGSNFWTSAEEKNGDELLFVGIYSAISMKFSHLSVSGL